jgi:hypothetical protein
MTPGALDQPLGSPNPTADPIPPLYPEVHAGGFTRNDHRCQTDPLPHAAMTCHGGSKERTIAAAKPVSGESRLRELAASFPAKLYSSSHVDAPQYSVQRIPNRHAI